MYYNINFARNYYPRVVNYNFGNSFFPEDLTEAQTELLSNNPDYLRAKRANALFTDVINDNPSLYRNVGLVGGGLVGAMQGGLSGVNGTAGRRAAPGALIGAGVGGLGGQLLGMGVRKGLNWLNDRYGAPSLIKKMEDNVRAGLRPDGSPLNPES